MAIPQMTQDLNIIQALSDLPNSEDGLTAAELKAKFDEAALAIQSYLNKTLVPSLAAKNIPFAATDAISAGTVQDAVVAVQEQVRDAAAGTIVAGSVSKEKLSAELLARVYGGRPWVSLDTPDEQDTPSKDFPIGQVWLRPGFTLANDAGTSWSTSGCTAYHAGQSVTFTGSGTVSAVTATQTLSGIGETGDRIKLLFSLGDMDSEITGLTVSINGDTAVAITGDTVVDAVLTSGGVLTVQFTVTWPSTSLATGSVKLNNYTVANLDKVVRQTTDTKEIEDWDTYLWSVVPFTSLVSDEAVFIQRNVGVWDQIAFEVLPVSRGGTGLGSVTTGQMLYADGKNSLKALDPPSEANSMLAYDGTKPNWQTKEEIIETLGALRLMTGTYSGTGAAGTVTLPVTPKLLYIYPESGLDASAYTNTRQLADLPAVLVDGAETGHTKTRTVDSATRYYTAKVKLSGNTLTFDLAVRSDYGIADYMNRSGETYHWTALY